MVPQCVSEDAKTKKLRNKTNRAKNEPNHKKKHLSEKNTEKTDQRKRNSNREKKEHKNLMAPGDITRGNVFLLYE